MGSAVKFLQDPKVQASSLGKKVAFLESKGLTSEEIEEAMRRANGTSTGTPVVAVPASAVMVPGGQYGQAQQVMMAPPPLPPKYDWKDMFIAAVVAGGFSYGLWQITKVGNVLWGRGDTMKGGGRKGDPSRVAWFFCVVIEAGKVYPTSLRIRRDGSAGKPSFYTLSASSHTLCCKHDRKLSVPSCSGLRKKTSSWTRRNWTSNSMRLKRV